MDQRESTRVSVAQRMRLDDSTGKARQGAKRDTESEKAREKSVEGGREWSEYEGGVSECERVSECV